jgi:hypothetical protein
MMGSKATAEGDGPGIRASRAKRRRLMLIGLANLTVSIALIVWLRMAKHKPDADFAVLPPQAAVAAAVLTPLIWIVTLRVTLRTMDELIRRMIVDSYSAGFVAIVAGWGSWLMLWLGGLAPKPEPTVLVLGGVLVVLGALAWMRLRRL